MNWRLNLRNRLSRFTLAVTTSVFALFTLTPTAEAAPTPGILNVRDDAGLFSAPGIAEAQKQFEKTSFPQSTHLTIVTAKAVPADKQAEFDKAAKNSTTRGQFFDTWAKDLARKDREAGIFVLMFDDGKRFITRILADRLTTSRRGFTKNDERQLTEVLNDGSQAALGKPAPEAQPLRDAALLKATEFVTVQLKTAQASTNAEKPLAAAEPGKAAEVSPLMGWLCIGLVGLLGIWLIMGLIRAFSGGGGGMGGGMGGGGFLTSLLGGMFGAAAGMYMYDQFFGGGVSDATAAGADPSAGDTGAGDWGDAGGGDAGGGDWGGDDFGGGDW